MKLLNSSIVSIVKCSWDSFSDFNEDGFYNISEGDFFRFAAGAVIFVLDNGYEIGFSSLENIASITVWLEKDDKGNKNEDYYEDDEELFLIKNTDDVYATEKERDLKGQKIKEIRILKGKPKNSKFDDLPNETGLEITFENGHVLVLSHNLIESPSSFAIAYQSEICESNLKQLTGVKII
ncbi:MAG: hypothetical protein AAGG68_10335 [Bacteroidota bacterium]